MNKLIYGVVAVLGVGALAVPFGGGMVMERVVRDGVARMNAQYAESGHDLKAEIVRYDRGYASSEVEWKIDFGKMKGLYGIDGVVFVDRASHGYGGIVSQTSLEKNPWYMNFVKEKLGGKDPLSLSTRYHYSGGMETTATLAAFTMQADNLTVAVKPGQTRVAFDKEFKKIDSRGSWQGLSVGEQLSLGQVSLEVDLAMISPFIWDGGAKINLASMTTKEEGNTVELADAKLSYQSTFDSGTKTLSVVADYRIASLAAGPDKFSNLGAKFAVKGLNAAGYEEFMKLYTKNVGAMAGDLVAAKDDPAAAQRAMEAKMATIGLQLMSAGEKLLTKGLEFQLADLRVGLPDGEVKGDVLLTLKKDMTFAQFIPLAGQPKLALEIFSLSSNFNIPEKLVADLPMLFIPVYQGMPSGLFILNGETATHKAETRDGKLYLNDKEFVLN
jgi:uncharacterized protein YdgA (DUF945 family)